MVLFYFAETLARFGSEDCKYMYEKLDILDARHNRTGCRIASYPKAFGETVGSTGE